MNRRIVILNLVFFSFCVLTTIIIVVIAFKTELRTIPTPEHLTGCWSLLGNLLSIIAVPGIIFELWLFGMVLFKVIMHSKEHGRLSRHNLVRLLLVDSMSWFAMYV